MNLGSHIGLKGYGCSAHTTRKERGLTRDRGLTGHTSRNEPTSGSETRFGSRATQEDIVTAAPVTMLRVPPGALASPGPGTRRMYVKFSDD